MRKTLIMDPETREMRVRYEDLWRGEHEVTEYRVVDYRGSDQVVRNMPDLDGTPVLGTMAPLHIRGPHGSETWLWTQEMPVTPTAKTPCPKATNARRKCALCS